MTATIRLAATARTTGRGALRNWRQRTSAHERWRTGRDGRAAVAGRSIVSLAQDRQRPARRDRLGRVRGEQLDGAGEPLELLVRGEEADADPERVEARRSSGRSRTTRAPSSSSAACGRPAGDPEREQRRHPVGRGQDGDTGDRRQPRGRRGRPPRARVGRRSRARRTSTASRSSGPSRRPTGRWNPTHSNRRASGHQTRRARRHRPARS